MRNELTVIYPQVVLIIRWDPEDLEGKGTGNYKVILLPKKFEWIL